MLKFLSLVRWMMRIRKNMVILYNLKIVVIIIEMKCKIWNERLILYWGMVKDVIVDIDIIIIIMELMIWVFIVVWLIIILFISLIVCFIGVGRCRLVLCNNLSVIFIIIVLIKGEKGMFFCVVVIVIVSFVGSRFWLNEMSEI